MELENFKKDVQSQWGEDGIIEEIFNRIGLVNKICVEFGAWDGVYLSNTWNLWHNKDWEALLIEGNSEKFAILKKSTKEFPKVRSLNCFVSHKGDNSLDSIFEKQDLPKNIDFLSIDIDGDDYYIFESLIKFRPRLIVIEYNPTIPPHLEVVQQKGEYFGSSALSLANLAAIKDYKLVHMTDTNMFFVSSPDFYKLNIVEVDVKKSFPFKHLANVITAYDGRALLDRMPIYMDELPIIRSAISVRKIFNKILKRDKYKKIEIISKTNLIPIVISKAKT